MTLDTDALTGRQTQAIAALLSEPTEKAAADSLGIPHSTLYGWMLRPGFKAAYRQARRDALEAAVGRLARSVEKAAETLERNLECGHAPTEVRCASALIDRAMRGTQLLELADMVEAYERDKADE
jgi:hypothetical protein